MVLRRKKRQSVLFAEKTSIPESLGNWKISIRPDHIVCHSDKWDATKPLHACAVGNFVRDFSRFFPDG